MNIDFEKKLGENIRRLRMEKKMTQDEVATAFQLAGCELTRSSIAKIEVGQRHLYPDEIVLLKGILGCTYEELLNV